MRKMYAAIAGAVVVALVATIAVLGISRESGYAIEDAGYTYAADGSVVPVSEGARYDVQKSRPVLVQDKKVTELDAAKVIRVEDGSVRLLNSAVAITSPQTVFDLVSKSLLARDGLERYTVSSPVLAEQQPVPAGSLVKTADGRYLVMDTAVMEHGEGESTEQIGTIGSEVLVALDSSGTVTFYDGETSTQQIRDRLRLVLDTSGYIFDLSREILIDPTTGAELALGEVLVEFDDEPTAGSVDRNPSAEPTEEATAEPTAAPSDDPTSDVSAADDSGAGASPAGAAGADGAGGGDGQNAPAGTDPSDGSDTELPELPELVDGRAQVPSVLLTAIAPVNTIDAALTVVDPSLALRTLQIQVTDLSGAVVASGDIDIASGEHPWSSAALTPGQQYVVQASGTYADSTGTAQQAVFGTVPLTVGALQLTSTTTQIGSTDATLDLRAVANGDTLTELVLRYRANAEGSPTLGTVTVDPAALRGGGTATVTIPGLNPQSSYVIEVETARAGGVDLVADWSTVVSTRATALTADGVQAVYSASTQEFTLSLVGLSDPDSTLTQVRYLAFSASDYAANGLNATIKASLVVGPERAAQDVVLPLPTSMGEGEYLFVALITSHDGIDDQQILVGPSDSIAVAAKHIPAALFSLDSAGADTLGIRYVINDQDSTIILDGSTHPVAKLYKVDATGAIVGSPVGQVDLLTAAELERGTWTFGGLERLTGYRVVLTATYDIGEGQQVDQVIGTSEVFTTTDVDPVQVTFALPADSSLITTTTAQVDFQFSEAGTNLATARLQVTRVSTGEVVQTLDIDDLINGAITPDWSAIDLANLLPNNRYQLTVVQGSDSGGNAIPVNGSMDLITRKRAPEATQVAMSADVAAATITARMQNGAAAVTDPDAAVTSIVYQLIDADDPTQTPISERTVTASGSQVTFDLLGIEGAGRGKTYLVRAVMNWSDNYASDSLTLDSTTVDVPKSGPTADLTYLSRDGDNLTVRVTVVDADTTVTSAPVLDVNGTTVDLVVGTQTVTVPAGPGALTVQVIADYQVLASDQPTVGEVLQRSSVLPINGSTSEPSATVSWSGGRIVQVAPSAGADLSDITLDTATTVTADGATTPDWSGIGQGTGSYAAQNFTLPQGSMVTGADYQVDATITARYRQNHLGYDALTGSTVYLATADGSSLVGSSSGRLQIGASGTAYQVQSASLAANGDVDGLELVNAVTGGYVGYSSYLNDTATSASQLRLVKLGNGTHVLSVNGRYVALSTSGSQLVTTTDLATPLFVYDTAQVTGQNVQPLSIPALQAPTVVASNLQVRDTSVVLDVTGSDPDATMLRDAQNQAQLWVSIYRSDDGTLVKQVQVPALSATGVTLSGLVGGVDYDLRVHGTYNLGDGAGDVEHVWFTDTITTAKSLPSLVTGPTLTWIQGCGANGRSTTVVATWDDPSQVLTGIRYDWYVKTAAFDGVDLTNTAQLEAAIAANGQAPVYSFDAGLNGNTAMPMFNGSNQNYYAGVTYVIAASMVTELPDSPEYLVSGKQLAITGPSAPTGTLSIDSVSQNSATATFTIADPTSYLTCASPMNFSYTLKKTDTDEVVDTGSFTVARTASGPPALTFTELAPGTGYTLVIGSAAHDLRENGVRSWSISKAFATADQFVTTNAVTFSISGSTGTARATNVQKGSADAITAARFELYRIDNYGASNQEETLVNTVPATVPADGGTVQADLDMSSLPEGIYYVRLVLTYTSSGSEYTYTRDSIGRDYMPSASPVSARAAGSLLWLSGDDMADGAVDVVVTDRAGNVLTDTSTNADQGTAVVALPSDASDVTVQVTDSEGTVSRVSGVTVSSGFALGSGLLSGAGTMGASL
ncbi:hypothetical protein [Cellulomonas sp. NPDC089187]|uniref:hypothetical protein n=1 Tax=Cellulomonas sp. NPDC089187 TaxID=3154970 RepID=UPI0034216AD0